MLQVMMLVGARFLSCQVPMMLCIAYGFCFVGGLQLADKFSWWVYGWLLKMNSLSLCCCFDIPILLQVGFVLRQAVPRNYYSR